MNTGQTVKVAVEAHDPLDPVVAHHRQVNGISRGQIRVADDDLACLLNDLEIDRQNLVDDLEYDLETRVDGISPVDGDIAVEDFL